MTRPAGRRGKRRTCTERLSHAAGGRRSWIRGHSLRICFQHSNSHKHRRSASRGQLQVPRIKMSTYISCAFGHAGPSTWNALPNILKCRTLYLLLDAIYIIFTSRSTITSRAFEIITVNALYKLLTCRLLANAADGSV